LFGLDRPGLNDEIRSSKKINYIRVIQRDGEIIQGEDFTNLEKKIVVRPKSVCPIGRPKTRQELIRKRRTESAKALEEAFNQHRVASAMINKVTNDE